MKAQRPCPLEDRGQETARHRAVRERTGADCVYPRRRDGGGRAGIRA